MASEFDQSDFVDSDYQTARQMPNPGGPGATASGANTPNRPPSLEEIELKANDKIQRLTELRQAQEALERERTALLEARRRRAEFQTGRQEMMRHLTRGLALVEKSEQSARRDAEQMAKTLTDLRTALTQISAISEQDWTVANYDLELTRALTAIENARMEWNSAQLKWTFLTGAPTEKEHQDSLSSSPKKLLLANLSFLETSKLGLALTWPLAVCLLVALILFAILLFQR
jgi:hypothetical protein